MCTLSILIHWAVRTYRSENLVKDWRCVVLQVREELPKISGRKLRFSSVFLSSQGQSVTYAQILVCDIKCEWDCIPAATLDSRGRLWLCCSSATALQWGRCGVTSKALLMSFCLQISDDGSPWQPSSEEGGIVQVLRFLIMASPYPAFPDLQMSSKRPQISQLLPALTILSKFQSSNTAVVHLSMMGGNTDECWISRCREP